MHSNVSIHLYPDSMISSDTLGDRPGDSGPFERLKIMDPTHFHAVDLFFEPGHEVETIDTLINELVLARVRVISRSAVPA